MERQTTPHRRENAPQGLLLCNYSIHRAESVQGIFDSRESVRALPVYSFSRLYSVLLVLPRSIRFGAAYVCAETFDNRSTGKQNYSSRSKAGETRILRVV